MKKYIYILIFLFSVTALASEEITLSKSIFNSVPFSSQFLEDGALIRNVNFKAVENLIPQLNKQTGLKLESRGEAHITVITPPEAKGWFTDHKGINYLISSAELHQKYFSILQKTKFKVVCVGKQVNDKGHIVFYLVVDSPDLLKIRKEIQSEFESRAKFTAKKTNFKASNFYPHITIGFVKGDIHGVSKGPETCAYDIILK